MPLVERSLESFVSLHDPAGIGGQQLQDSTQRYLYLVVKPASGEILISQRTGDGKPKAIEPLRTDAAVIREPAGGGAASNKVAIRVERDSVKFLVNENVVRSLAKSQLTGMSTDGLVGLRVNHNRRAPLDASPVDGVGSRRRPSHEEHVGTVPRPPWRRTQLGRRNPPFPLWDRIVTNPHVRPAAFRRCEGGQLSIGRNLHVTFCPRRLQIRPRLVTWPCRHNEKVGLPGLRSSDINMNNVPTTGSRILTGPLIDRLRSAVGADIHAIRGFRPAIS